MTQLPGNAVASLASAQKIAAERFSELPLNFEANQGQTDSQVRFLSRGNGYSLFLTPAGAVLTFSRDARSDAAVLRMELAGVNPKASIRGEDELPGRSNYFFGSDSRRWRTGVPTYAKVAYENVYPGINLVYYGNQQQLEYDFVVAPGADPRQIRMAVAGAQNLTVDTQGNLILRSAGREVRLLAPKVHQQIGGRRLEITGQWALEGNNIAGFRLGSYDRTQALVIDPVLLYSSFLGGSQENALNRIALDAAGNAYVAGYTTSGDFPAAPTPQVMTFGSTPGRGAFVAKIDASGSSLLYTTYLSGSVSDEATGLAVDSTGNVYLAGNTHSPDFPTVNALQSACPTHTAAATCSSAFLAKIDPAGDALLFSTYLGGSGGESARGLAIDAQGSAYVAGVTSSVDFPVTAGVAQTRCGGACQQNAFVAKFTPSGQSLAYASYVGGSGVDDAADIAVDASGSVYLAGKTTSHDFPVANAYQKTCPLDASSSAGACLATAFVTKLKADGSAFTYSTYLGGSLGSQAAGVAVDSAGSAYVAGSTKSSDFPVVNAFQKSCSLDKTSGLCSVDAFLTKFAPSGKTLVYSTYLGGSGRDEAFGVVVDAAGSAHVVGRTESGDFPTVAASQSKLNGASDAFVARFTPDGSALTFSTYHGGSATESGNAIALDAKGAAYVTGLTTSTDFPTSHPFQSSCAGACTSAFVSKMAVTPAVGTTASNTVLTVDINPSTYGQIVTFTATVSGSSGTPTGSVDFMDGATLLGTSPLSAGVAKFSTSALSAGSHSMTGAYSGDTTYAKSTSAVLTETVNTAPLTITANSFHKTYGTTYTPTGNEFTTGTLYNGDTVTSVTLASPGFASSATVVSPGPTYTITPSAAVGTGLGNYTISYSTGTLTVDAAALTITANSFHKTYGATYTPTGHEFTTGTLYNGDTVTSVTLTSPGFASSATVVSPGPTYTITPSAAVGTGLGNYTISYSTGTLTVDAAALTITANNQSKTYGATLTLGTTAFTTSGLQPGDTVTGVTLTSAGAAASATVAGSPYPIVPSAAVGTGLSNYTITYVNGSLTVNPASTTTTVTAKVAAVSATSSTFGQTVTFTAAVAVVLPGVGIPNGTVDFTDNGTAIAGCTGTTVDSSGNATCTTSALTAGSQTIKGTYNPTGGASGNFVTSFGTMTFTVSAASTTTTMSAVPASSSPLGQSVTFTAAVAVVSPGVGIPNGTVDFTDNGTAIAGCTGTTVDSSGNATCTTSALSAGSHTIKGTYNPTGGASGNFVTSSGTMPYTVVAPPTINKAFSPTTITLGNTSTLTSTDSSTLTFTISNPAANTVAVTGVAFTDTLQGGLTVAATLPNTCGGTYTASGSGISLSGATVPAGTGGNPGTCSLSATVVGTVGGLNIPNTTGTISSANGGPGTTSNTATITVQDYSISASQSAVTTLIQGGAMQAVGTVTVTPLYTYNGAVSPASPACGPAGFACSYANLAPGSYGPSPVTAGAAASTPVGLYADLIINATDSSVPAINHNTGQTESPLTVAVECTYSVGNSSLTGTVPIYTPAPSVSGAVGNLTMFATETSGGTVCPWTANGTANVTLATGSSSGLVSGAGTGSPVTFTVTAIPSVAAAPQTDQVTISYFQYNGTTNQGSSNLNVVQEVPVTATSNVGVVSSSSLVITTNPNNQSGFTLTFPLVQGLNSAAAATVCSAVAVATDGTITPDPSNLNYGFSCAVNAAPPASSTPATVPLTGSSVNFTLQVSVPAGLATTSNSRADRRSPVLLYALLLGLPGIVFAGTGTLAFGSRRQKLALTRLTSILLLLGLLSLLPACAGGFKATFGGNQTAGYSLTVMAYVTDGSNNVQGVEIFTVPLTIVK